MNEKDHSIVSEQKMKLRMVCLCVKCWLCQFRACLHLCTFKQIGSAVLINFATISYFATEQEDIGCLLLQLDISKNYDFQMLFLVLLSSFNTTMYDVRVK